MHFFPQKSWRPFSRCPQNTGLHCNCTKHFTTFPGGKSPLLPMPAGAHALMTTGRVWLALIVAISLHKQTVYSLAPFFKPNIWLSRRRSALYGTARKRSASCNGHSAQSTDWSDDNQRPSESSLPVVVRLRRQASRWRIWESLLSAYPTPLLKWLQVHLKSTSWLVTKTIWHDLHYALNQSTSNFNLTQEINVLVEAENSFDNKISFWI